MSKLDKTLLFLGKQEDAHGEKALAYCQEHFAQVTSYMGTWGQKLPAELKNWEGDYIVSYLSRWVVPKWLLDRAQAGAINFHAASPEYPAIGCNNFALYEEAEEYGSTCHHMAPKVDTGAIVAVKRFPVLPSDTVASVLAKTYDHQLELFYEVFGEVVAGRPLPESDETWTRPPFTREQFNELGRITPDMSQEEVAKRVRATSFGVWQPVIELHGYVFELISPGNEA